MYFYKQKFNVFLLTRLVLSFVFLTTIFGHASSEPLNLSIAKKHVKKYHEGGQYHKDLRQVVNRALKHFKNVSTADNAAVVFDIDATILSDYRIGKEVDFGYIPELSHEWVLLAEAHAIKEPKELYDYLVKRGFHIIFLTGRQHDEYDATLKNLQEQGFDHFDKLILRSQQERDLTALVYKTTHRKKLIDAGYRIVGTVGDQWSDHNGGYTEYKVKIPNVQYIIE